MKAAPLPAPFRQQPFRVADALPVVGEQRLRRRDLWAPARGVREAVNPADDRVLTPEALALVLRPRQHFSHVTAAEVWGLPVPRSPQLHTATVGGGSVTRRPNVVGHRVSAEFAEVHVVRGLRVSSRLSCWAECASILPLDDLVALGDALVVPRGLSRGTFSGAAFHSLDDLERVVNDRAGSRGARRLREALALVRVGSQSPRETRLRLELVRAGVRMPLLNCEIHDSSGHFIARPDFVFGRERVCVEYDGDHHRTNRPTYRDDKRRREALADAGWHTLYLSDDDLDGANWHAFLGRLDRALARGEGDYRRLRRGS